MKSCKKLLANYLAILLSLVLFLTLTACDPIKALLGNAEEVCSHENKTIVASVTLQDSQSATIDNCKLITYDCPDCDEVISEYTQHTEWVPYIVDAQEYIDGESGYRCVDCGFKKDIQTIPAIGHVHNYLPLQETELSQLLLSKYGEINPCEDTWYSGNGYKCTGCGDWYIEHTHEATGHIVDTESLQFPIVEDRLLHEDYILSGTCLTCGKSNIFVKNFGVLPVSSQIRDTEFFKQIINNTASSCNVQIWLKKQVIELQGIDKFSNNSTVYNIDNDILVFSHTGSHILENSIEIESRCEMTLDEFFAIGGTQDDLGPDNLYGILYCSKCTGGIIINIK